MSINTETAELDPPYPGGTAWTNGYQWENLDASVASSIGFFWGQSIDTFNGEYTGLMSDKQYQYEYSDDWNLIDPSGPNYFARSPNLQWPYLFEGQSAPPDLAKLFGTDASAEYQVPEVKNSLFAPVLDQTKLAKVAESNDFLNSTLPSGHRVGNRGFDRVSVSVGAVINEELTQEQIDAAYAGEDHITVEDQGRSGYVPPWENPLILAQVSGVEQRPTNGFIYPRYRP